LDDPEDIEDEVSADEVEEVKDTVVGEEEITEAGNDDGYVYR